MEARSVPVLLALIAAPVAIFRRRNKDEWLGELDGIRDDALGGADDEIGPAMAVATDAPRPTPNRERPGELWHAPLDLDALTISPEMAPEEHLESADLVDPSTPEGDPVGDLSVSRGPGPVTEPPPDPSVDVVAASDVQGSDDEDHQESAPAGRSRLRPPTDIFDVAPAVDPETVGLSDAPSDAPGEVDNASGLVGEPVGRRPRRATAQRSLFGGGGEGALPSQQGPAQDRVQISDGGEVVDQRGTIRVAERTRPEIIRSPSDDSLALEAGWCWVARASGVPPARISLPSGVLVVPGATRALAVVESDRSAFISVVSGAAHLEHPTGLIPLPAGAISHVPSDGSVTVDTASPDEMAADAILTRNLRMDDALDAINGLRRRSTGA